jgi:hypothetical protein
MTLGRVRQEEDYHPPMALLTPVATDIWTHETTLALPLGLRLPLRMTVIRLPSGQVLIHNPVALDDELVADIASVGPVAELAAPNLAHHLFLGPAAKRFPTAAARGPRGLAAKKPDVSFAGELGDEPPAAYEGALETIALAGAPGLGEVVFFHRPSRTLLVTDLVFNVQRPANVATACLLTLTGTRGRLAKSRVWRFLTKDRAALSASIARVLAWDFTRVLMAHGDPLVDDAHAAMARVLRPAGA